MGLKTTALALSLLACIPDAAFAGWTGPQTVANFSFGVSAPGLGIAVGDTIAYDLLPSFQGILANGKAIISDLTNEQLVVVDLGTSDVQKFPYQRVNNPDGSWTFRGPSGYALSGNVVGYIGQSTWEGIDGAYYEFDHTGTLIRETTERPLELGRVRERFQGGQYVYESEYVDRVFVWDHAPATHWMHPVRINDTTLMHVGRTARWTVTEAIPTTPGEKPRFRVAMTSPDFEMPEDTHECFDDLENITTGVTCHRRTAFGQTPIIGPDGSVYTYKAVYPGNPGAGYYVLKWTWQE